MRTLASALLLPFLIACGSIQAHHVNTGQPSPPHTGDVRVVLLGSPEPSPFREIAIIQVRAHGNKANLPSVVQAMQERARQLGCNAVIRVRIDQGTAMAANGICGVL
ncbi:MAG: heavy metal-binding domain-containing protein [Myxococcales bacterium]|nr:heavy metal-binding domain-containing protein [Myxococcales bacterium]